MALKMNSIFRSLLDGFRGKTAKTPIGTDLNKSPRQVSIDEPRATKFSDASAKGDLHQNFLLCKKVDLC